jgi:Tol biopolymer transport system component
LKPANIKITSEGRVKLLDFGIAKLAGGDAASADLTQSPTVPVDMTREGMLLGTAPYMSPEQARGQVVDTQTDVWAFACVLFEMLAGRSAFSRPTLTDTLAAVVSGEPDWAALPSSTPGSVVRVIRRGLEKDRKRRLHAIADARLDLDEISRPSNEGFATSLPRSGRKFLLFVGTAALVVLAVLAAAVLAVRPSREVLGPTRVSISAPGQVTPQTSVAVSPDGRRLTFVSTDASGRSMLWMRDLDSLDPRVLTGTEDAAHPFWAPDGSAIGFLAGGKLKRVDAIGGRVLTLADVTTRSGASWSRDGIILFSPRNGELATVAATGGPVSTVLTDPNSFGWPSFLPDGRHFVFFRGGASERRGVYLGSLDSTAIKPVVASDYKAAFVHPAYLLFIRGEVLLAQPFDMQRFVLTGEPTVVTEGVWRAPGAAQASFSASETGVLAYVNAALAYRQLAWFDRTGRPLGTVGEPGAYLNQSPRLAPDGSRLVIGRGLAGVGAVTMNEVWVTSFKMNTATRLTLEPGASEPVWSSDGQDVLFQWTRGSADVAVSRQNASGTGSAALVGAIGFGHLWDSSPDGQSIVFGKLGPERAADLWLLKVASPSTVTPFAESRFHKTEAQIAPNGQWVAYTSYESGRDEVYVESFPSPGNRRQISVAGGMQPSWRRDGAELFFLGSDQTLMAMPVTTDRGRLEVGRATPLFRTRIVPQGSQSIWFDTMYDVTSDGQRFVINGPPDDPGPPITVVINWQGELKARMPAK